MSTLQAGLLFFRPTSSLVSNCSQSPVPVGRTPIVEHLYKPSANLEPVSADDTDDVGETAPTSDPDIG